MEPTPDAIALIPASWAALGASAPDPGGASVTAPDPVRFGSAEDAILLAIMGPDGRTIGTDTQLSVYTLAGTRLVEGARLAQWGDDSAVMASQDLLIDLAGFPAPGTPWTLDLDAAPVGDPLIGNNYGALAIADLGCPVTPEPIRTPARRVSLPAALATGMEFGAHLEARHAHVPFLIAVIARSRVKNGVPDVHPGRI